MSLRTLPKSTIEGENWTTVPRVTSFIGLSLASSNVTKTWLSKRGDSDVKWTETGSSQKEFARTSIGRSLGTVHEQLDVTFFIRTSLFDGL